MVSRETKMAHGESVFFGELKTDNDPVVLNQTFYDYTIGFTRNKSI